MSTDSTNPAPENEDTQLLAAAGSKETTKFDYIIVGSGAGGGPLACRLALAGKKVLLIEAGQDHGERETYQVPGYHGAATEDDEMSWSNSVRHYSGERQTGDSKYDKERDPSSGAYNPALRGASQSQKGLGEGGVCYPRSSGLGGCTEHHAMIVIRPNDCDWDHIAQVTGDDSWRADKMRPYFARFENCLYRSEYRGFLGKLFGGLGGVVQRVIALINPRAVLDEGGHGSKGWQPTSFIAPLLIDRILKSDSRFGKVLIETLLHVSDHIRRPRHDDGTVVGALRDVVAFLKRIAIRLGVVNTFDPNDLNRRARSSWEGAYLIPIGIKDGRRHGVREFILDTQEKCKAPDQQGRLVVEKGTFVTKVILEPGDPAAGAGHRAVGVEYTKGNHLYEASPLHPRKPAKEKNKNKQEDPEDPPPPSYYTCGEVILSGGSYNTPQLLMLSGIGEKEHLTKHNIETKVDLKGVGRNLQDRYEVCVVSRMRDDFKTLENMSFTPGDPKDPARTQWLKDRTGLYATNGGSLAIIRRSQYADGPEPDLFTFGAPVAFRGYYWDWSKQLLRRTKDAANDQRNLWSWVILKAYTRNNGGTVRLRNDQWQVPPDICFASFSESKKKDWEKDVQAIQEAISEVRDINHRINRKHPDLFVEEIQPGADKPDSRAGDSKLGEWVQNEAWGHHACGTCRIGQDKWQADPSKLKDEGAVLSSDFRVHGVTGLRVVDASVFPKIPGYFILAPIFMISEKAADTLLSPEPDPTYPEAVRAFEEEAILQRRELAKSPASSAPTPPSPGAGEATGPATSPTATPPPPGGRKNLPPRTVGLALSGGGIRSATFVLGVLQALAAKNRIRALDYISTVSGGGFTGSFLGRLFMQPRVTESADRAGRVQEELQNNASPSLLWLRRNANYLISSGSDDWWQMLGIFYRNLLAVQIVVGLFLFGLFGLLTGIGGWDVYVRWLARLPGLPVIEGLKWSPWWWLPTGILLLGVIPCTLGYWLAPKPGSNRPHPPHALGAWLVLVGASAVALTLPGGFRLGLAGLIILGLAWLWQEVARLAPDADPRQKEAEGIRVRNRMTRLLEETLKLVVLALAWVVLDTVAVNVAGQGWTATTTKIMAALAPLSVLMRNNLLKMLTPGGGGGGLGDWMTKAIGVILAILWFLLVDVLSHELFGLGSLHWFWGTVIACLAFSVVLGRAFDLLNFTSLHSPYAARITRTFQGAANESRVYGGSGSPYNDVQVVHPGDDIPHHLYRPERNGGPLHLINVCVNENVDYHSLREVPDRRGLAMAVGSFGVSVASYFATWVPPRSLPRWRRFTLWLEGIRRDNSDSVALKAIPKGYNPDQFHPLGRRDGEPTVPEKLTLGGWTAVSGAAFSTGIGRNTSVLVSTLRGLMNLRLGYWWNSGTLPGERPGLYPSNLWRKIKDLPSSVFASQYLLLAEWRGRFRGPSRHLWNLSDGGHQEVTGLYELIRRRVEFMIVCDAGEDRQCIFTDVAELDRQVFQDFGATVTWIDLANALWMEIPGWIKEWFDETTIGLPHTIKRSETPSAAFAVVNYADNPAQKSWILLLKPSLGKNQSNVALYNYAVMNADFPQQSTTDQFFDDVQWESYRRLGHAIGTQVIN